jgi:hypothetical protein
MILLNIPTIKHPPTAVGTLYIAIYGVRKKGKGWNVGTVEFIMRRILILALFSKEGGSAEPGVLLWCVFTL